MDVINGLLAGMKATCGCLDWYTNRYCDPPLIGYPKTGSATLVPLVLLPQVSLVKREKWKLNNIARLWGMYILPRDTLSIQEMNSRSKNRSICTNKQGR